MSPVESDAKVVCRRQEISVPGNGGVALPRNGEVAVEEDLIGTEEIKGLGRHDKQRACPLHPQ